MDIAIEPGKLSGTVDSPISKSDAHRKLICAALSETNTSIEPVVLSEDIEATLGH